MDTPQFSIIVAAFNEQGTIERCVRRVLEVYPTECEVLVVDGGSDRTGEIVMAMENQLPQVRYIRNENDRGKGHAIRVGIEQARAPIHAQIDADIQFLPEELPLIIDPIREGKADVTLGSRFAGESKRLPGSTPFIRTMGNKTVSGYASLLFWHRMTDVQAGMKAWTADAIRKIDFKSDNYSYEVEIPTKALKRGCRVIDVPITTDARQDGETNVNAFTAGVALFRDITLFRLGLK